MIRLLIAALALLALAACGGGPDKTSRDGEAVVIRNVAGGVRPRWTFNGDIERPTIQPSIRVRWSYGPKPVEHVCHSFLTDGRIRFHGTSHPLGRPFETLGNRGMARILSGESKRLWSSEWSHSKSFTDIPARQFARLDRNVRMCGAG